MAVSLKRLLIKNSLLNLAGYFYLLVASLISIPIILSSLGKSTYGVLVLFTSLVPLVAAIDFGLSPAIIRALALPGATEKEKVSVWQSGWWMFLVSGLVIWLVVWLLLLLVFRHWVALESLDRLSFNWMAAILAATLFVNHINSFFLTLPQAKQRFDIYNVRTWVVGTGNTLATALVAYLTASLIAVLAFQFVWHLVTGFFLAWWSFDYFGNNFWPKIRWRVAKQLLSFGGRNFVGKMASQLHSQLGNYALGGMLSAGAVTVYSIPQNIIYKGAGAISQLTLAFFPLSASLTNKERIDKLVKLIIGLEFLIFGLGLVQLLLVRTMGEPFLLWWLKDAQLVSEAFPVLKVLSWFFLLTTLTPIPAVVLDSLDYPQVPSSFAVFTTIFSLVLILYLTPTYGVLGPAYALVISSLVTVPTFLSTFVFLLVRFRKRLFEVQVLK